MVGKRAAHWGWGWVRAEAVAREGVGGADTEVKGRESRRWRLSEMEKARNTGGYAESWSPGCGYAGG